MPLSDAALAAKQVSGHQPRFWCSVAEAAAALSVKEVWVRTHAPIRRVGRRILVPVPWISEARSILAVPPEPPAAPKPRRAFERRPSGVPPIAKWVSVGTAQGKITIWYWRTTPFRHYAVCGGPNPSSRILAGNAIEAIRLGRAAARQRYGKGDRRGSLRLRFAILERDAFTCRYCGRKAPDVELHVDHVVAIARGGTNEPENLVTSCADCNLGKASK